MWSLLSTLKYADVVIKQAVNVLCAHIFKYYIFYRFLRAVFYRQLMLWYEILRAVQGISHYRVVVTIKYDQHSRTLISELTRSLKKQLDGSSSFVSVLFAVLPNSFKI